MRKGSAPNTSTLRLRERAPLRSVTVLRAFNILLKALRDTSLSVKLKAMPDLPYTVNLGKFLDLQG